MKGKITLILAAAFLFAANMLCAQFIERDGKTNVEKDDGSLVEVQIKTPPPSDEELYRPARAGKFGTPHRGAWLRKTENKSGEYSAAAQSAQDMPGQEDSPAASFPSEGASGQALSASAAQVYTAVKSGRCILCVELIRQRKRSSSEPSVIRRCLPVRENASFSTRPEAKISIARDGLREVSYPLGLNFSVSDFSIRNFDGVLAAVFDFKADFAQPKASVSYGGKALEETPVYSVGTKASVRLLSTKNFSAEISSPEADIKFRIYLALGR